MSIHLNIKNAIKQKLTGDLKKDMPELKKLCVSCGHFQLRHVVD